MPKYLVELSRTIRTTVSVQSDSPEGALHEASRRDFPLPPRNEWNGDKDWEFTVMDANGTELIDADGNNTEAHPDNQ